MALQGYAIRVVGRSVYKRSIDENRTYEDILSEYPKFSDADKLKIIAWIGEALKVDALSKNV